MRRLFKNYLKKTVGVWLGYYCRFCLSKMEEVGYNFRVRCSNEDCPTRNLTSRAKRKFKVSEQDVLRELVDTERI